MTRLHHSFDVRGATLVAALALASGAAAQTSSGGAVPGASSHIVQDSVVSHRATAEPTAADPTASAGLAPMGKPLVRPTPLLPREDSSTGLPVPRGGFQPRGGTLAYSDETLASEFSSFTLSDPATINTVVAIPDFAFAGAFAADGNMYAPNDTTGNLERIDTSGTRTVLGPCLPVSGIWAGFSYDHSSGVMYGVSTACGSSSTLYTINLTTGAPTTIATLSISTCAIALAIDTNGDAYVHDIVSDSMYTLDLTTGAEALLGATGFNANFAQGMDFDDATGTLYMSAYNITGSVAELRTVDTTTGATTLVGQLDSVQRQFTWLGIETASVPLGDALGDESQMSALVTFDLDTPGSLGAIGSAPDLSFAGDYGPDGAMYVGNNITGNLDRVTEDGTRTVVGSCLPAVGHIWGGFAWNASNNRMYAVSNECGAESRLYVVDLASGATNDLGPIATSTCSISLAIDTAGNAFVHDIVSDSIYSLDLTNGSTTLLGPTGFDGNFAQGMDFDDGSGNLYMSAFNAAVFNAELRLVDTVTGNTTLVGPLGGGELRQVMWLGIRPPDGPPLAGEGYATETQFLEFDSIGLDDPATINTIVPFTDVAWAGDFADDGHLYVANEGTGNLERVETDGTRTVIGACLPTNGETRWTGFAFNPVDGTMYATASTCGAVSNLYKISLQTAAVQFLSVITNSTCMIALAIDSAGQAYGHDLTSDSLLRVNLLTGAGTVIGQLGFDANFGQGLDFTSDDELIMAAFNNTLFNAELRTVDLLTGATTPQGVIGDGALRQFGWFAIAPECVADWNGDGILNTSDFLDFLNDYNLVRNGNPFVFSDPDLAPPFGVINTSDLLAYINLYVAGCP